METKIIKINDYISIPFRGAKVNCPISRLNMTTRDLDAIMNTHGVTPPLHIYAICPKDNKTTARLTRANYRLTNAELFPEIYGVEVKVEAPVEPKKFETKTVDEIIADEVPVVEEKFQPEEPVTETPVEETPEEVVEETAPVEEVVEVEAPVEATEEVTIEETIEVVNDAVDTAVGEETITVENTEVPASNNNNYHNNNYNKNKKKKNR